jgi:hypothetical protein
MVWLHVGHETLNSAKFLRDNLLDDTSSTSWVPSGAGRLGHRLSIIRVALMSCVMLVSWVNTPGCLSPVPRIGRKNLFVRINCIGLVGLHHLFYKGAAY